MKLSDSLNAIGLAVAAMCVAAPVMAEQAHAAGVYTVTCHEASPGMQAQYDVALASYTLDPSIVNLAALDAVRRVKWTEQFDNLVTTLGKNYLLDNGMAGAAFTAAFYMGLISSVSYTGIAAADTSASHAGWLESGVTNAPTYSGARKTAAWAAANAGAKALSAGLVFTFTGAGTVKGCFLTTASAVDAATGTVFSAGLFSGGDQPVVSTNTLTVSYSLSL